MDARQVRLGQERVWRDVADDVVLKEDLLQTRKNGENFDGRNLVASRIKKLNF